MHSLVVDLSTDPQQCKTILGMDPLGLEEDAPWDGNLDRFVCQCVFEYLVANLGRETEEW